MLLGAQLCLETAGRSLGSRKVFLVMPASSFGKFLRACLLVLGRRQDS